MCTKTNRGRLFASVFMLITVIWFLGSSREAQAATGDPITMAAFGDIQYYNHQSGLVSNGDTWGATLTSDGAVIGAHDDGDGISDGDYFIKSSTIPGMRFVRFTGTPDDPSGFRGAEVSQGELQPNTLSFGYHSMPYEVDGVLYNWDFSSPNATVSFHDPVLRKSTDHGATWTASTNTASTMGSKFGWPSFVVYNKGGSAPAVDNADRYVYFFSFSTGDNTTSSDTPVYKYARQEFYLARVLRSDLPSLDATKFQYYKGGVGGDGSLDANWDSNIDNRTPFYREPYNCGMSWMVYNQDLGRYIMTRQYADFKVMEAPHPWGPWTMLYTEGIDQTRTGLTHNAISNAYISDGGQKMWAFASGNYQTGLQYGMHTYPIYFTQAAKSSIEAENAALLGTAATASSVAGYSGTGYVSVGFTQGNGVRFTVNASQAGQYIVKFRYYTGATSGEGSISAYVNGVKQTRIPTPYTQNRPDGTTWFESSRVYTLNSGNNTFDLMLDSSDMSSNMSLMIDKIDYAFLQTDPVTLGTRYQGESAAFTGDAASGGSELKEYYGIGYAKMQTSGSTITFNSVNAASTKNYKLYIRYSYPNGNQNDTSFSLPTIPLQTKYTNIALYVNGAKIKNLSLGSTITGEFDLDVENVSLTSGSNTIKLNADSNGGYPLYIDYIEIVDANNIPSDTVEWRKVDDNATGGPAYSGFTFNSSAGANYFRQDSHYSGTNGAYAQFSFTGTGVRWIGGKNNDHGYASIYIDGSPDADATVDTYNPTAMYRQMLYEKTGLTFGPHTMKIVVTNAPAPGYYQSVDEVQYTVNLVANPGFENGTTGWSSKNACTLTSVASPVFLDSKAVKVSGRTGGNYTGPLQDITSQVRAAGQGNYYIGASLRSAAGSQTSFYVNVTVNDSAGAHYFTTRADYAATIGTNSWTYVSAVRNITWTGTLTSVTIDTESNNGASTGDYYVDNVTLIKQ